MKQLSFKKLSILGLVLMAASAVTAAIIPSKSRLDQAGKLVASTGGGGQQKSCVPDSANTCNVTANSATTTDGVANNGRQTNGSSANQDSSGAGSHSSHSPE